MDSENNTCNLKKIKEQIVDLRNAIIILEAKSKGHSYQIGKLQNEVMNLENCVDTIDLQTEFIRIIIDLFSPLENIDLLSNNENNSILEDVNKDFSYSNDDFSKLSFYFKYNEPSIFINLVLSVIFNLFLDPQTNINFQGANSSVTYFSVNIFPITTIYKNIPYYTYPSTNYWTVMSIDTTGSWTDKVKYFSFTPYIGQYTSNGITYDYLGNCNSSITSTLLKANNPGIFSTTPGKVYILYTFNRIFASLFSNPRKGRYAILIPDMIDSSTFTIVSRFEKERAFGTINFTTKIRAFTFSEYPTFLKKFEKGQNIQIATKEFVSKELQDFPVIDSNYNKNATNIDEFITIVKDYNSSTTVTPLKIFPYFYLANNNTVVTDVYQLIDSGSTCNALINDFNKNYYNSESITIRDGNGNLLFSKFIIVALNHTLSGYATSTNIQIYNVDTQKSIKTYSTSSELPFLSNSKSPSDVYNVSQSKGLYVIEIDVVNESFFDGVDKIAFFERVGYPIAFTDRLSYVNSGPRYSSFTYDANNPEANPSEDCSSVSVNQNNIYNIQTNDPNFSLHLNYCKYSTLNFRVYSSV
jgi:hypothetical protein